MKGQANPRDKQTRSRGGTQKLSVAAFIEHSGYGIAYMRGGSHLSNSNSFVNLGQMEFGFR